MSQPNPFDFSDFGPPRRPATPVPGPHVPGARPNGPGPTSSGFDPFAGQPPSQAVAPGGPAGTGDVFGGHGRPAGGAADVFGGQGSVVGPLPLTGPPLALFGAALAAAVLGVVVGLIGAFVVNGALLPPLAGWLLAGPVAILALAQYSRVDTRRRTDAVYSAPTWTGSAYWLVLAVCLVGIAVAAWQIALWAGRL